MVHPLLRQERKILFNSPEYVDLLWNDSQKLGYYVTYVTTPEASKVFSIICQRTRKHKTLWLLLHEKLVMDEEDIIKIRASLAGKNMYYGLTTDPFLTLQTWALVEL